MNKKLLLALAVGLGFGLSIMSHGAPAHAGGTGYLQVLYPNSGNEYWIKGKTYDITFYSRGWDKVRGIVYCENYSSPATYDIPVVGATDSITLQTWHFTVPTNWADQSQCHVQIAKNMSILSPTTPGVTYDDNDVPFHIATYQAPVGKLQISDIMGLKSNYAAGEMISVSVKALKPDGTPATPTDGLNVAVILNYTNPDPSGASGPGVGGSATYDPATGLWKWSTTTLLAANNYTLDAVMWCPLIGSKCIWLYGDANQVDKTATFSVGSGPTTGVPTVDFRANGKDGSVTVPYYNTAQLSWTSTNATSCVASAIPLGNLWWTGSQSLNQAQSTTPVLTVSETLTLTCSNAAGQSASDSIVVNVVPAPPWHLRVWDKTTGAEVSKSALSQVPVGDILWFVVEGPANQWYRYCFMLNGASYSCDSTFSAYQTDVQGRNDYLQVVAGIGQSTGSFDASVYGDGFTSNHVLYTVGPISTYSPSPSPSPTCLVRPACLDANPRCMIAEPAGGWCPRPSPTISPTPYVTPSVSPWPTPVISYCNPSRPVDPTHVYSLSEICDGDLIRAQGDIAVWIVKIKGDKRWVRRLFGPQIFKAYGHLNFSKVKTVSPETLQAFKQTTLIKRENDPTVYELSNVIPGVSATIQPIVNASALINAGHDFQEIYTVNGQEFKLYRKQ